MEPFNPFKALHFRIWVYVDGCVIVVVCCCVCVYVWVYMMVCVLISVLVWIGEPNRKNDSELVQKTTLKMPMPSAYVLYLYEKLVKNENENVHEYICSEAVLKFSSGTYLVWKSQQKKRKAMERREKPSAMYQLNIYCEIFWRTLRSIRFRSWIDFLLTKFRAFHRAVFCCWTFCCYHFITSMLYHLLFIE